jgi:hypothetical protein
MLGKGGKKKKTGEIKRGCDILATRKSETTKIRVKTKSEGYDM